MGTLNECDWCGAHQRVAFVGDLAFIRSNTVSIIFQSILYFNIFRYEIFKWLARTFEYCLGSSTPTVFPLEVIVPFLLNISIK